ncbi:alpha/beta fold hydrolase [Novispirillum sp. DQ9]|uniref:alpha/beta fold hydrolase n=1 Tax=Novispirillum sp. DQ9 TaxID=3398612 RepID=UPI003C7DCD98
MSRPAAGAQPHPQPDPPPPPRPTPERKGRLGPRPLPLYLAVEGWSFLTSSTASLLLRSGWPISKGGAGGPDRPAVLPVLPPLPDGVAADAFAEALDAEARRRFAAFLDGVQLYRDHPYRRRLTDPPLVWRSGAVGLRDYGGPADGIPVLVVPSQVNRGYILDLTGKRSFMRHLAKRGFRPFLVDWGWPGEEEHGFDLTAYITRRLEPALDHVRAACGGRAPIVAGYCMGGLLALALCLRRGPDIAGFLALATPWNFHADDTPQMKVMMEAKDWVAEVVDRLGEMPVDLLQAMFSGLDPRSIGRKFRAFSAVPQRSAKANAFVGMEDWVNDGVPLAGPVALECLLGWYGDNTPHRGEWTIAGAVMDPRRLTVPSMAVIPRNDRIVPPGSSGALAAALPGCEVHTVALGHVGLIVGSAAVREVYGPAVRWMRRAAAAHGGAARTGAEPAESACVATQ